MNYHFIAIGGAAMHNLAIALKVGGHKVTGSDDEIFEPSRSRLADHGLLPPTQGWNAERVHPDLDAIILGMHAKKENPELQKAHELGIKVYSFPSFLYEHAKDKKRIVIGGSHGKTTITSMIIHALELNGRHFDFMVGAKIEGFDVMVRLSDDADVMIFEGDEYLTSPEDPRPKFHVYMPHVAVISGIAWDHMNVFPTYDIYVDQFRKFISLLPKDGKLFYSDSDADLVALANEFQALEKKAYSSLPHKLDVDHAVLVGTEKKFRKVPFFGQHNLMNAEAARLVCGELGLSDNDFYEAMTSFKGAGNRLETIFHNKDLTLFRDFAHAPSKVKATTSAVRERFPDRKLIVCFELHTYSSLNKEFLPQYGNSLDNADLACVLVDPHAFEWKMLEPFSSSEVKDAFKRFDLLVVNSKEEIMDFWQRESSSNQAWLFMSSGNFGGLNFTDLLNKTDKFLSKE